MESLPQEILIEIFSFTNCYDLVNSFCRVNKMWYSCIQEYEGFWRPKCLKYTCSEVLDALCYLRKVVVKRDLQKKQIPQEEADRDNTIVTPRDLRNIKIYQRIETELALIPTHLKPRSDVTRCTVESSQKQIPDKPCFQVPSILSNEGLDETQYSTEDQLSQFTRLRVVVSSSQYEIMRRRLNRDPLDDKEDGNFFENDDNIFADRPFPKDSVLPVYYFEFSIKSPRFTHAGIGLSIESLYPHYMPGWIVGSYGYHGDDGGLFNSTMIENYKCQYYGCGDTVGMGIWMPTNEIFVTKNGEFLGIAFKNQNSYPLYPCIGVWKPLLGDINFGRNKPFMFDLRELQNKIREENIIDYSCYRLDRYEYHLEDEEMSSSSSESFEIEDNDDFVDNDEENIYNDDVITATGLNGSQPENNGNNYLEDDCLIRDMAPNLTFYEQYEMRGNTTINFDEGSDEDENGKYNDIEYQPLEESDSDNNNNNNDL